MKRFIPTILLVVVCIGAFWYASSQNFFKKEDDTNKPQPLFTFQEGDVTSFWIQEGNIGLEKKDGKWLMTKPDVYRINTYSGDSWAGAFSTLMYESEVADNASDLVPFGLDKPEQQFTATLADGTTHTLLIGASLPIAGHHYAKLKDTPVVYQIEDEQIKRLQKELFEFLDKGPFPMTYNEVSHIEMTWNGAKKAMGKTDTTKPSMESSWVIDGKEMSGKDAEPILDKMLLMSTDQMVRPASELSGEPQMTVVLKSTKDGQETKATFTGTVMDDFVWIAQQGEKWAYAIPTATIDELFARIKLPEPPPAQ